MKIAALIVVAGAVVLAALAATGVIGAPLFSPTLQEGEERIEPISTRRAEQRLSNSLFELVPGQVLDDQSARDGRRFDVRMTIRNFDARTLNNAFWEAGVEAYDIDGVIVPDAYALLPSWGGFGRMGSGIAPGGQLTGTLLIVGPGVRSFFVTFSYDEPGRGSASASFVYPYGR